MDDAWCLRGTPQTIWCSNPVESRSNENRARLVLESHVNCRNQGVAPTALKTRYLDAVTGLLVSSSSGVGEKWM